MKLRLSQQIVELNQSFERLGANKASEERRKRNGLPPHVVILPDWYLSEDRHDEEQARRKPSAAVGSVESLEPDRPNKRR